MSHATFDASPHEAAGDRGEREELAIGLVNNMPDAALQSTERQFRHVLARAAGGEYDIRLRLFSLPELVRGDECRAYIAAHYEPIAQLWNDAVDGLIVTGAEPRTACLQDEAYWPSMTRLIDRAIDSSTPSVWSCLAAHAAILHLDGIARHRLPQKLSGVFRCAKSDPSDPLVAGLPATWRVPHSRLNTLDAAQLASAGYRIASLSDEAGVDTAVLRRGASFVFYQGHPEYDDGALFREYRRDVGRFLAGIMDRYPELPRGYFDDESIAALTAFRARAERQRTRVLLDEFPGDATLSTRADGWHDVAGRLYRNWLVSIVATRGPASMAAARGSATSRAT